MGISVSFATQYMLFNEPGYSNNEMYNPYITIIVVPFLL